MDTFECIPPWFLGAIRLAHPAQILTLPLRCQACGEVLEDGARVIGCPWRLGKDADTLTTVFIHAEGCGTAQS